MAKNKMPKGMRAIHRGNKTHYYLDNNRRKNRKLEALGSNFSEALVKYAELTSATYKKANVYTFNIALSRYLEEIVPKKAERTQKDNIKESENLLKFFDKAPLEQIKPMHVRQYLDWRNQAPVRANREIALFSHIFNWARQWGYTDKENPCLGNSRHKEKGRKDIYVSDDYLNQLLAHADLPLQYAIKIAYLSGQRPSDVLDMQWQHIYTENDINYLFVEQNKTKTKLSIAITGELAILIDEIKNYQLNFANIVYILCNEKGEKLTYSMLRNKFDKARLNAKIDKNKFQFRDLRAKAGTDTANSRGVEEARKQLGHTSQTMTLHYYRDEKGQKTEPTK